MKNPDRIGTIMSSQGTAFRSGIYKGMLSGYMVIGGSQSPANQLGYSNESEVPCD
ncbi:hypothetical protein MP11Mi_20920 [Gordonia sp. MP11Mi]|uniref:Uncharacterized protein n=1 Tax=Gordonia sp. MP11Mi TaxID=3022769 RepID=A0AA97CV75_9ACTN